MMSFRPLRRRAAARPRQRAPMLLLALAPVLFLASGPPTATARDGHREGHLVIAQADADDSIAEGATRSRPLEPRYQPREPENTSGYNDQYIFAMSRGLADSTIAPAGKAPLFLFTVPIDLVLLPFAVIGGFFG